LWFAALFSVQQFQMYHLPRMTLLRRVIALVCILAILLAVVSPSAYTLLAACIVALVFLSLAIATDRPGRQAETAFSPASYWFAAIPARAPPKA